MSRRGLVRASRAIAESRYEVIPTPGIEERVAEFVPSSVTVTVTASPTKGLEATLEVTTKLRAAGYDVVPHVAARSIRDRSHLSEVFARLTSLGVTDVFVPAGDAEPPAGPFDSSLSLLEALAETGREAGLPPGVLMPRLGVTGYPESHPKIGDDVTIQSMWDKRRYASYIVSNLCFDAKVLDDWIKRVRARRVTLPLRVGIAGPVDRTRLLAMASKIGVADSARYLRSHSSSVLRLGAPGGYDPDRLLARIGSTLADPASIVEGLHIFTFNQLRETQRWRTELLERLGVAAAAASPG
jgi:methylenetetrahydrofolate reductase (NADPH)